MQKAGRVIETRLNEKFQSIMLEANKLTAPSVGIFDAPTRCYEINEEWAKIVMGMVSLLAETKLWDGALDESHPAIAEILKFLEGGDCVSCADVSNCVESDPLVWDLSKQLFNTSKTQTQNDIAELEATYDGTTPQSVFPDIPTTAPSANANDEDLLCYALTRFVELYASSKNSELSIADDEPKSLWDEAVDIAKKIWGTAVDTVGSIWDAVTGTVLQEDAKTATSDDTQIANLACCLLGELKNAPVTETTWGNALATCAGSSTLAALTAFDLVSTTSFIYFLEVWNAIIQRDLSGEMFHCPCDEWCLEWSGDVLQNEWFAAADGGGTWDGSGWTSTKRYFIGRNYEDLQIGIDWTNAYVVRRAYIYFDCLKGEPLYPEYGLAIRDGDRIPIQAIDRDSLLDAAGQMEHFSLNENTTGFHVYLRVGGTDAPAEPGGFGRVRKIVLVGTGTPPPFGTPC